MIVLQEGIYWSLLATIIGYVLLQTINLNVSLWRNPLHYSEDATRVS